MQSVFNSPIGLIQLTIENDFLINVDFIEDKEIYQDEINELMQKCKTQLSEYFEGKRFVFDLPIKLNGTEFQKKVWNEVSKISFGKTKSYLQIAEQIGDKNSIRAVGLANAQNPIPIIIPCHRVIGSDGKLVGYAGGLQRKKWLINHEAKYSNNNQMEIFQE